MSVIKHKGQRVGIFIDSQNLYHSGKNLYKSKVNFGQIVKDALAGRSLIRAIAYVITTESGEEQGFFEALSKVGIETKTKNLQIFSSGAKKADWDVGMAIDAVMLAEKVDVIILMTGDGDFVPLVEYLHGRGVMVEVIAFTESTNAQLKTVADSFVDISSYPEFLLRTGRRAHAALNLDATDRDHRHDDHIGTGPVLISY